MCVGLADGRVQFYSSRKGVKVRQRREREGEGERVRGSDRERARERERVGGSGREREPPRFIHLLVSPHLFLPHGTCFSPPFTPPCGYLPTNYITPLVLCPQVLEFRAHSKVQSVYMVSAAVVLTGGADGAIRRWVGVGRGGWV